MATADSSPNSRSSALDLVGQVLDGRYRIVRRIGAGGMGAVYEAEHVKLRTRVAVKVLKEELAVEETHRLRFLREARAATSIASTQVVQITDFGEADGGIAYFVMEYLEGSDLERVARAEGPISWPRARHILMQIAAALRAAHAEGIVHRDIKPANVLVFDDPKRGLYDFVKVLDFGIAKVTFVDDELGVLTATGEAFGTPAYMAPELAEGQPATPATDIYAFGILAYRILTGHLPFKGDNHYQVLARHRLDTPVAPREIEASVPPAAEQIILRCLAKQASERFGDAAEIEAALQSIPVDSTAQTFALTLPLKRTTVPPMGPDTAPKVGSAILTVDAPATALEDSATTSVAWLKRNALILVIVALIGVSTATTTALLVGQDTSESQPHVADAAEPARPTTRSAREDEYVGASEQETHGTESMGMESDNSSGAMAAASTTAEAEAPAVTSATPSAAPPTKKTGRSSSVQKKEATDSSIVSKLERRIPSTCGTRGTKYDIVAFVRPNGEVVDVEIKGGDASTHSCIEATVKKQTFPSGKGRKISIQI